MQAKIDASSSQQPAGSSPVAEASHLKQKFFEYALELFCVASADGYFLEVNPAFPKTLGYTYAELYASPFYDLIHPNDRDATLREIQRLSEGSICIDFRNRYRCKNGEYRWLAWTCQPDVKTGHLFAIARDVTVELETEEALRKSEALLNATHDIAQIGSWEWDAKTDKLTFSDKMLEIAGIDAEAFDGSLETYQQMLSPTTDESLTTIIKDGFPEDALTPTEYTIVQPDGSQRIVWAEVKPFHDQNEQLVKIVGAAQDITERKQLESQLSQAQKLESIGQLAAGVAHEINTPVQYIGDNTNFFKESFGEIQELIEIYSDLFEQAKNGTITPDALAEIEEVLEEADFEYLAEEIPKAIDQTIEGIERVARIVRAMKEFSHPGQEEKSMMNLNKLLETTMTVARNEWKYVADIELDFDPALPEVPCHPGELNQVFLNIMVNAAHAIEPTLENAHVSKGKITLRTLATEDYVEVQIADSGTGIPVKARKKIFDPFYTTKEVGKGTGQGLAIAHGVVTEKHGGRIYFETELGEGTTFFIQIPLKSEET